MAVPFTSNKLLVRPRSGGGLQVGERPAPYPYRSADLCDLTTMTRHVARSQGVHEAKLGTSKNQTLSRRAQTITKDI
jgi:hypothetical protein